MKRVSFATAVLCVVGIASAQDKPATPTDPMSEETKQMYSRIKGYILKSAEKMPEGNYSWKPTPAVRSFGGILGHIADDQYFFCGAAKGEEKKSSIEKDVTTKAGLLEELKTAFAYCDSVYDGFTDAKAGTLMKFGRGQRSLSGILNFNVAHNAEHYGNLITYLRISGLVPPSSESQQ